MSKADVDAVATFLGCLKVGDIEGAIAEMTDDVELVEAGGIPHSGTYRGAAGVYELVGKISALFGGFELNHLTVHDAGDFVVGRMTATFISKSGEKRISMPVVEHYRLRDGKLCHADVYYKDPSLFTDLEPDQKRSERA